MSKAASPTSHAQKALESSREKRGHMHTVAPNSGSHISRQMEMEFHTGAVWCWCTSTPRYRKPPHGTWFCWRKTRTLLCRSACGEARCRTGAAGAQGPGRRGELHGHNVTTLLLQHPTRPEMLLTLFLVQHHRPEERGVLPRAIRPGLQEAAALGLLGASPGNGFETRG